MRARSLYAVLGIGAILSAMPAHAAPQLASAPAIASHASDTSLSDYRAHLQSLASLVEACAKARDIATCDPMKVGPDDRVPLSDTPNSARHLVRYGWLRVLLSKAQDKDKAPTPPKVSAAIEESSSQDSPDGDPTFPTPPTTTQLLNDAETRLAQDLAQANGQAAPVDTHAAERKHMQQILAGRDFRRLEAPSARESLLEKFGNWLNNLFSAVAAFSARSAWIGRLLVGAFILVVCVGLVLGLLQLERRWRVRLIPENTALPAGAPSARDWQLWLEDARQAAAAGLFREAIHFVYWAAISRLESRRLWPADRARTPREYLALVGPEDPRKPGLATLTRSFERTWYGGRPAAESDYRRAEQLAGALISGSPSGGGE